MRLALAPLNPTVGDLDSNRDLCAAAIDDAQCAGADLLLLPELVITGYPPRDLLWDEGFVEAARERAASLARLTRGITVVVGAPRRDAGSGAIYNSLFALRDGAEVAHYDKRLLPTYDVFDEDRYFTPGESATVIEVAGRRVGLAICEDLWRGDDAGVAPRYRDRADPVADAVCAGAEIIVVPSASPFVLGKSARQREILRGHAARRGVVVAAVNQFGANDELIFDGHAAVFAPEPGGARLVAASAPFAHGLLITDIEKNRAKIPDPLDDAEPGELLWKALTLGVRDYVRKTGFERVVVGLSGGIDSAVTACLAVGAIGATRVLGVGMPGRFSSEGSVADARELAQNLGARFELVPIDSMHRAGESTLEPVWRALGADPAPGVAEENIQSRLRGVILMAISNKTGALVLTTGNKSELAVGYCTLYGDMNGGLAVLSDVPKTLVFSLASWINANHRACGFAAPPIPASTITKPPSAELRPDQTDQDTLPPYDVLDAIVERAVERRQSPARIARETGFDPEVVARVARMIDMSEYKRRQSAPGLKISSVAFGSGRRRPIAQGWRPERVGG